MPFPASGPAGDDRQTGRADTEAEEDAENLRQKTEGWRR